MRGSNAVWQERRAGPSESSRDAKQDAAEAEYAEEMAAAAVAEMPPWARGMGGPQMGGMSVRGGRRMGRVPMGGPQMRGMPMGGPQMGGMPMGGPQMRGMPMRGGRRMGGMPMGGPMGGPPWMGPEDAWAWEEMQAGMLPNGRMAPNAGMAERRGMAEYGGMAESRGPPRKNAWQRKQEETEQKRRAEAELLERSPEQFGAKAARRRQGYTGSSQVRIPGH